MRTIIFTLSIFLIMIICFSMNKSQLYNNQTNFANKISNDTIVISDSVYQVLSWKGQELESIRLHVNRKSEYGEYVVGQIIKFHSNGVVKLVRMTNGVKLENERDYMVNVYQQNEAEFSEEGELQSSQFMKNFKVVSSYKKKK